MRHSGGSSAPLSQQFAPRRGPPPGEEESGEEEPDEDYEEDVRNVDGVEEEGSNEEKEEQFPPESAVAVSGSGSFQEIHMAEGAAEAALIVDERRQLDVHGVQVAAHQ
ncbi:hypothetical protein PHYBOEH_005860 [Phytophthora boehmeriae]|uniref:Uncharacterized protein n=1 Tax=Phytophthora boehmeriae TaxID=109152 RepID=A0A8T1WJF8_9STRA|nr:hypothetical protein PHYBOEH_005860 [Phytophthora boehmeriae]